MPLLLLLLLLLGFLHEVIAWLLNPNCLAANPYLSEQVGSR
jgi:hypothetical protein